jgi:hypothetical protein
MARIKLVADEGIRLRLSLWPSEQAVCDPVYFSTVVGPDFLHETSGVL